MSYAAHAAGTRAEVMAVLTREAEAAVEASPAAVQEEVRHHFNVGTTALWDLLAAVGSDDRDEVNVSIYGHATAAHAEDGTSPETLTVAVHVTRHYVEPPEPVEDEASDDEASEAEPVE